MESVQMMAQPNNDRMMVVIQSHKTFFDLALYMTWVVWVAVFILFWFIRDEDGNLKRILIRCTERDYAGKYLISLRIGKVTKEYKWSSAKLILEFYDTVEIAHKWTDESSDTQQAIDNPTNPDLAALPVGFVREDVFLMRIDIGPDVIFSTRPITTTHESELRLVDVVVYTKKKIREPKKLFINHTWDKPPGRAIIVVHSVHFRDFNHPEDYLVKIVTKANQIRHVPIIDRSGIQKFARPLAGQTESSLIGRSVHAALESEPHPNPKFSFTMIEAFAAIVFGNMLIMYLLFLIPYTSFYEVPAADGASSAPPVPMNRPHEVKIEWALLIGFCASILGMLAVILSIYMLGYLKRRRNDSFGLTYKIWTSLIYLNVLILIGTAVSFGALSTAQVTPLSGKGAHLFQMWILSYGTAAVSMLLFSFFLLIFGGFMEYMADLYTAERRYPPKQFLDTSKHAHHN